MLKCKKECKHNFKGECVVFGLCAKLPLTWMVWHKICPLCKNKALFITPLYNPNLDENHPGNYKQMYREM